MPLFMWEVHSLYTVPFHLKGNMQSWSGCGPETVEHPLGQED